jgi:2-keto-4-pentenoate hydratase/2-oxohepta-3-ene-1,7-dioic acid hydratase in catechol pathway
MVTARLFRNLTRGRTLSSSRAFATHSSRFMHRWQCGTPIDDLPLGAAVCVASNYCRDEDHLRDIRDHPETRDEPMIFCKSPHAIVDASQPILIGAEDLWYEAEMALLIDRPLGGFGGTVPSESECLQAVRGVSIALDLTKKKIQNALKAKNAPWEISKTFPGACPLGQWLNFDPGHTCLSQFEVKLTVNGEPRQHGYISKHIWQCGELLQRMAQTTGLNAGDVVLVGTGPDPGPLRRGDHLKASLLFLDEEVLASDFFVE